MRAWLAGWVMAAGASGAVQAEVWAFIDADGVAHVAPQQVDSRYRRVIGDAPGGNGSEAVPGKTDRTEGLLLWLQIAPEVKALAPLLREAALAHGVDEELLKAVIAVESGFNARAVSPRGAIGLMQITPVTGDRYATPLERRTPAATRLLDPKINVHTGARMLADLNRRYGGIDVALAAWNAGEGTVRRHGGKLPDIAETRAHVQMVLELYWALLQERQARGAREMKLQPAR
ncbi:lytic transglycosylase domain-containing protein [Piscinibacter aquaticus]|uniref:Lytic transglycosylase domain-containing protein n=1 Tax=Piscinibacter aquaticus TaxID=392597 RepID=A0A5C6TZY7_9BURK|nr:lytic transglycosylase domain-containing protein [Piscinibacter aquaticus]